MATWVLVAASVLLAVAGGSHWAGVKSLPETYESCTTIGKLSCSSDCLKVEVCIGNVLEEYKKCPNNTMCDSATAKCVAGITECEAIDKDTFTCHGPVGGRFPNPYDCHSYFTCDEVTTNTTVASPPPMVFDVTDRAGKGVKSNCSVGTAYDSLSTTCRFKDTHRVCKEGPVPECKTPLQNGALVENPNIYYVCLGVEGSLVPWLAKCADPTTIFQDGNCVSSDLRLQNRQ